MQISGRFIDDFKTDRKGITPPLPAVLRLVPIGFYCAIAVAILLSAVFLLQYRIATQKRDGHRAQAGTLATQTANTLSERTALEVQIKKAINLQTWVSGSRPLQPLVVEISRSMGPKANILDLSLVRDEKAPAQVALSLKIGTDSVRQLDTTLEKIASQQYRAFSPTQTLGQGELDYRATLVRQGPKQTSPADPVQ